MTSSDTPAQRQPRKQAAASFRERLASDRPLVLDGGLATELEARGFDLADPLWSARFLVEAPEALSAVHREYVRAGAECVIAATYQATLEGFRKRGLSEEESRARFHLAARLARESGAAWIAASVSPYGATLADGSEYTGDYGGLDEATLRDAHATRFALLAETDVDVLACETLPNGTEARALVALAAEHPERSVWYSFSCKDGRHLRDGTPLREAARLCADAPNTAAIGINCTAPRYIEALLGELCAASELPIVVYPNSGEDYDLDRRAWRSAPDDIPAQGVRRFAESALRWRAMGARLIGGCCRIGPEHIRGLAQALL